MYKRQINETENEKFKEETKQEQGYEILGITACPTGIAHTYMAAEALENAGKEVGHLVKIETQGQSGVKNKLTKEEIKNAKAIIIAADIDIDLSRFKGKKILKAKVADGIHKPKELIEKALTDKNIPVYQGNGKDDSEYENSDGVGSRIYRHLMNGVTHMLPFVVGGGILIAIAFLLGLMVSVGLVFLIEYLDNTFKSKEELERELDIPVVGIIPEVEEV